MKKIAIAFLVMASYFSYSQTLNVGVRLQYTQNMYWENGISAQYSFANLKPKQFYMGFDYVTTRLGSAMGTNAMKQDNYLLSSSYYFFKDIPFHIYLRLNAGYFYADMEEEMFKSIPHQAFLLSPEFGLSYDFKKIPIALNLGLGYYIDFAKEGYSPGTFQPLYYHLDIYYTIFKNKK